MSTENLHYLKFLLNLPYHVNTNTYSLEKISNSTIKTDNTTANSMLLLVSS